MLITVVTLQLGVYYTIITFIVSLKKPKKKL